jgi:hypothetical protein
MRMCMKMTIDTEAGNRAIKDGTLPKIMQTLTKEIKPEASYFTLQDGQRTAFYFFTMTESMQMPIILEPLFMSLQAKVEITPTMNADELMKGIEALKKTM